MKKSIFLPLCLFFLVGCATGPISSSQGDTSSYDDSSTHDDTSLVTTEVETNTSESSEEDNSSESSSQKDTETTITTPKTAWTSEEKELMHTHLEGMEVPFVNIEYAYWTYDGEYEILSYMKDGSSLQDCNDFVSKMLEYENAVDVYGPSEDDDSFETYYHEIEITIESFKSIRLSVYMLDATTFNVDAFPFIYSETYVDPKPLINELFGAEISVPGPSFENSKYYSGSYYSMGVYLIEMYFYCGSDLSETYINDVLSAGYVKDEDEYGFVFYIDPSQSFMLDIFYNPNLKAVMVTGSYVGE